LPDRRPEAHEVHDLHDERRRACEHTDEPHGAKLAEQRRDEADERAAEEEHGRHERRVRSKGEAARRDPPVPPPIRERARSTPEPPPWPALRRCVDVNSATSCGGSELTGECRRLLRERAAHLRAREDASQRTLELGAREHTLNGRTVEALTQQGRGPLARQCRRE
jgi:hypothetical protein